STWNAVLGDSDSAKAVRKIAIDAVTQREYEENIIPDQTLAQHVNALYQLEEVFPDDVELKNARVKLLQALEARIKGAQSEIPEMKAFEEDPFDEQNNANLIEKFTERDNYFALGKISQPVVEEEDTTIRTRTGTEVISGQKPKYSFLSEGVNTEAAIQFG
ncbi:unnamed protein product, partial [marine sediment metagenome]